MYLPNSRCLDTPEPPLDNDPLLLRELRDCVMQVFYQLRLDTMGLRGFWSVRLPVHNVKILKFYLPRR